MSDRCLHHLFEAQAQASPDHVAVTGPDATLTYGELDRRADALAMRLRQVGVERETIVAVWMERSTEFVIAMLAVLKAGGAYLPLDRAFPEDRVRWMIADSRASVVVIGAGSERDVLAGSNVTVVVVGEAPVKGSGEGGVAGPPARGAGPADLAYVIYTSGSTGTPKGVLVEHRNVVRLLEQTDPWFAFNPSDVWSVTHSFSFDFSVWELWGALAFGGRAVIVSYDVARSPGEFVALVARERVTVLNQTPTAFRQFAAREASGAPCDLSDLRLVIFGGERLDVSILTPFMARHGDQRPELVNMYGITETTVHASYRRIRREDVDTPAISPIGVPLPDLRFYLLDDEGHAVEPGQPGELFIAGDGVTRGYLYRDDLTGQRFVHRPVAPGVRLYRSGDRAVRLDDGGYAYLGRRDDQIKVRGFRIEPGEVEAALCAHPEVNACVVLPRDYGDGDVRLVAYLVPVTGTAADQAWIDRIQGGLSAQVDGILPRHMRPSSYIPVAALPVTTNGKVDKVGLQSAFASRPVASAADACPDRCSPDDLTATQAIISALWCSVLDVPAVGLDDDFFDLGGTSLALVRMFAQVNDAFGTDLEVLVLLDGATVAVLSGCVDAAVGTENMESRV